MSNSIMMDNMQTEMSEEFARFNANPQQYLLEKGLHLEPGTLDNPQKAVEYIIQTHQGTPEQLNQFKTMLSMFHN